MVTPEWEQATPITVTHSSLSYQLCFIVELIKKVQSSK
jgi:hypothetical protein